jgi:hypothetical protein
MSPANWHVKEGSMRRNASVLCLGLAVALAAAAPGRAATSSRLAGGSTDWFYNCGDGQTMYIGVMSAHHKVSNVATLQSGDRISVWVNKGELVSWRCGAPVTRGNYYIYATVH